MSFTEGAGGQDAASIASRLVGGRVALHPLTAGRNSRVFRVEAASGRFALKLYPRPSAEEQRLRAEVDALDFLAAAGITNVPRTVATDVERAAALFTWIDGVIPSSLDVSDIDQSVAFLSALHHLRMRPAAARLRDAREACLAGIELVRQVDERMERLLQLTGESGLQRFLSEVVAPPLGAFRARATAWAGRGYGPEDPLPCECRTLSPSDFGFHNSLRDRRGRLSFLDFEYFGWDDPVKVVSDMLLHPGYRLEDGHRGRLRCHLSALYQENDPDFGSRLDAYFPLFGIRWVLILLNEFLPERWERRVHAGDHRDWQQVKSSQIEHARSLMARMGAAYRSRSSSEMGA